MRYFPLSIFIFIFNLSVLTACYESEEGFDDGGSESEAAGDSDLNTEIDCPAERSCQRIGRCCDEGQECVDERQCLPICPYMRCGDNREVCCEPLQFCLDGVVCAADCGVDQELCGVDLELCCYPGDVCLNDACVAPGEACLDDFDCRSDEHYCEPSIGACLPTPGEPLCEIRPEFDEIELEVEWHWEGVEIDGTWYHNVTVSPVVGDISGDGIPDVVVIAYADDMAENILVGLSGLDGILLFAIPRGTNAPGYEGVALADFDPSDAALEVVYRLRTGGVRVVDGNGTTEISRRDDPSSATMRSTLEIADLNADGTPDVIAGCIAYNGVDISDPSLDFFNRGTCGEPRFGFSAPSIADLDLDGFPEVTSGGIAISADGDLLWDRGALHGLSAVADLNLDGLPEVIVVRDGSVVVVAGEDGRMLIGPGGEWATESYSIPGGGNGGAPTVADFDGDGLPEISAAGQGAYAVYDPDCLETPPRIGGGTCEVMDFLRWEQSTQDISSSITGSSVFDFQGDGVAEVIYNDECFLHVYDGRTGENVLAEVRPNSSRTSFEYPIVVDVDADGNSEIVVGANNDKAVSRDTCPLAYAAALGVDVDELPAEIASGTSGVYVFGDPGDRWVPTRSIWNQFSYHVSNVTADGHIPAVEVNNWAVSGLNNYRQNVQGHGIFNAPNLSVTLEATEACAESSLRLSAVVANEGSRGVEAGVPVEFRRSLPEPGEVVASEVTLTDLLPGASERITVVITEFPTDVEQTFQVFVDPGEGGVGMVSECHEDDNDASAEAYCAPLG